MAEASTFVLQRGFHYLKNYKRECRVPDQTNPTRRETRKGERKTGGKPEKTREKREKPEKKPEERGDRAVKEGA
jgi:hypothetical protein